jgi:thiamine biosynthesis lipoprotein
MTYLASSGSPEQPSVEDAGEPRLSRREVLRIFAVSAAALSLPSAISCSRSATPVTESRVLMGTVVNLTVMGPDADAAKNAAAACLDRMESLEGELSRYRPDSDVSVLNRTGRLERAPDSLLELLALSLELSDLGDGAFDVTVGPLLSLYDDHARRSAGQPTVRAIENRLRLVDYQKINVEGRNVRFAESGMAITLDGIAKGYVVDAGVSTLKAHGFRDVLVEAGGDLVAAGDHGSGRPWRLGIQSPRPEFSTRLIVEATDRALATSGDYMQTFAADRSSHHILDPRTGYSPGELASATVVAPTAAQADGLATLVMVLGAKRGVAVLDGLPGCEGCTIGKDLEIVETSGFSAFRSGVQS